ncbi:MAG: hypothetical protein WB116_02085 [Candidatus Dormiibacterota bacterium]
MAASTTATTKAPATKLGSGFAFILAGVVLAVAWKALPGARFAIGLFVAILMLILWVTRGGTIETQIAALAGK